MDKDAAGRCNVILQPEGGRRSHHFEILQMVAHLIRAAWRRSVSAAAQ